MSDQSRKTSPTIGVVVPLYNKAATIARALRSITSQTHPAHEIVVVDDGSTDGSAAVVCDLADPRIRLIRQANGGVSIARNTGIAAINTELVALLDADDEWKPNHLQSISALRSRRPDCDLLASGYVVRLAPGVDRQPIVRTAGFVGPDGFVRDYFALASRSDPPITSSSVVASKRALEAVGGFPTAVGQGEDLLTWARLAVSNRLALNEDATAVIWQPEFNTALPTRRPEAEDHVGAALRQLLHAVPSWQIKSLRAYVAQWHKMRGSMYLALGERRLALFEFRQSYSYAFDRAVIFKTCMTILPVGVINRIVETWRATAQADSFREDGLMKILWVNPSFLDYRVPVYADLDRISGGGLHVMYSTVRTPERVDAGIRKAIGSRAIGLTGEHSLGMRREDAQFANTGIRIPYQPGLVKRALEIEADVVIAEGFFQWTPAAMFKCIRQRLPLVISYERTAHTERNCPRWRTLYRRAVVKATSAMACNGRLSRQYASETLGMPADKITTGQMVVDVREFIDASMRISADERQKMRDAMNIRGLCYLYVGSMTRRKGVGQLLDAWAKFTADGASATLVLVGDGEEKSSLEETARNAGLTNVRFSGPVAYGELPAVYNAADVFVMPTLEDNWSLVVPEAMACGLPILCSIYNGCWPELINDGSNGWTFDPLNIEQLAATLGRCVERQLDLPAMGSVSRQIISEHTPAAAARAILAACELARGV